MPAQTPTAADALRRSSRAVVLIASHGAGSRSFQDAVRESGVAVEFFGHPLLATAELCRLEREAIARGVRSRSAFFVVDRDIDDLETLFTTVQTRLPRVSIWVVQGDIVIPVRLVDSEPSDDGEHGPRRGGSAPLPGTPAASTPPKLRFVEGSRPDATRDGEPVTRGHEGDARAAESRAAESRGSESRGSESRGEAVTSAELDMLLGFFDDGRDGHAASERGGSR